MDRVSKREGINNEFFSKLLEPAIVRSMIMQKALQWLREKTYGIFHRLGSIFGARQKVVDRKKDPPNVYPLF
jgi:hypothetical protein